MANFFHYVLWRICIHFIQIVQVLYKLFVVYRRSYDLLTRKSFNEIKYIEGCRKEWQKIPRHLLVVVGREQQLSPKVLANLALYALLSNIECISFYDTRNKNRFEPSKHIPKFIDNKELKNGLFSWTIVGDKSGFHKHKNGVDRSIEIAVFSENHSKPLLAEVCAELRLARDTTEVKEALADPTKVKLTQLIDKSINKKLHNLPDPELVIIFNDYLCTFGALPWSTSFSEFHKISTENYTTIHDYVDVMYKYAKCEQRFGK